MRPGRQHASANALPVLPTFRVHLPAIARRECASNWKQLRRCLPLLLLHEGAISWPSHFLPSRQPIFFLALGYARTEFRSLWPTHRDAARALALCGVDQVLPSIFAALRGRLSLSAIRL